MVIRSLGLDILGLFPRAPGGYHYLYVAVDKFTKWAEVEAVRIIPAGSVVKFIKGLMSRFGVLIASSPATVHSSPAISSKHIVLTLEHRYATVRWDIPGVTARQNAPTRRS